MNVGSYEFPGDGQTCLTAPSHGAYNFGTGPFTVEAWVKTFDGGPILGRKALAEFAGDGGYCLNLARGSIQLLTDDGSGRANFKTENSSICDGTWHHIAAVRNGPSGLIYLDGVPQPTILESNSRPPLNVNSSDRLTIGALDQQPSRTFSGNLAEIRLWRTTRKDDEIQNFMAKRFRPTEVSADLVGYWPGEFGIVLDFSLVRNSTGQIGSVGTTGLMPPISVGQDDMLFLYYGIYDTFLNVAPIPRLAFGPWHQLAITSMGFIVQQPKFRDPVIVKAIIRGNQISWTGGPDDLPPSMQADGHRGVPISISFLPKSATWSVAGPIFQGALRAISPVPVRGVRQPQRYGCGLLLNVGTGKILSKGGPQPTVISKTPSTHNHFCEYDNGGILDMASGMTVRAVSASPGTKVQFGLPDRTRLHLEENPPFPGQSWTFTPRGTVTLTSAPSIALTVASDNTSIITATADPTDDMQKWLALSNSQLIFNGTSASSVLIDTLGRSIRVQAKQEGRPQQLWFSFRSAFISEATCLALTVIDNLPTVTIGSRIGLQKWDPTDARQEFTFLNGSILVHKTSGLVLSAQDDGSVTLAAAGSSNRSCMWSLGKPVPSPNNVMLPAGSSEKVGGVLDDTEYLVVIRTGNYVAAGTNDRVEILLFNPMQTLAIQTLTQSELHEDPFERGCTDRFRFRAPDIGGITGFLMFYGRDTWFFRDRWVVDEISVWIKAYPNKICTWRSSYISNAQFEMTKMYMSDFKVFEVNASDKIALSYAPARDPIGPLFGWHHTWITVVNQTGTPVTTTFFDCAGGHGGDGAQIDVLTGNCSRNMVVLMSTGRQISSASPLKDAYGTGRTDGFENADCAARGKGFMKWDGQCHQIANRYLWTAVPPTSIHDAPADKIPIGYGLTCCLWGQYGVGFNQWAMTCGFAFPPLDGYDNPWSWIQEFIPLKDAAKAAFNAIVNIRAQAIQTQGELVPDGAEVRAMIKEMNDGGATVPQISKLLNITEAKVHEAL